MESETENGVGNKITIFDHGFDKPGKLVDAPKTKNVKSEIEKRFKCDECPSKFRKKYDLKVHFRVHTGEKPFKCDTCDKAFSQSITLKNHQRRHLDEKIFKCVTDVFLNLIISNVTKGYIQVRGLLSVAPVTKPLFRQVL